MVLILAAWFDSADFETLLLYFVLLSPPECLSIGKVLPSMRFDKNPISFEPGRTKGGGGGLSNTLYWKKKNDFYLNPIG